MTETEIQITQQELDALGVTDEELFDFSAEEFDCFYRRLEALRETGQCSAEKNTRKNSERLPSHQFKELIENCKSDKAFLSVAFRNRLQKELFATNNYERGCYQYERTKALKFLHVEANHPKMVCRLIFDIDSNIWNLVENGFGVIDLPQPSWAVLNKDKSMPNFGFGHIAYELEVPIPTFFDKDSKNAGGIHKAKKHLEKVKKALMQHFHENGVKADPCYKGFLVKNPYHSAFKVFIEKRLYTLKDFAHIRFDASKAMPALALDEQSEGRNHQTFNAMRYFAYSVFKNCSSQEQLFESVFNAAQKYSIENHLTSTQGVLLDSELKTIARSVSAWVWNYRVTGTKLNKYGQTFQEWSAFTHNSEYQRARGYRSGQARFEKAVPKMNEARGLAAQGMRQSEIAQALGVSQQTVSRWLKN